VIEDVLTARIVAVFGSVQPPANNSRRETADGPLAEDILKRLSRRGAALDWQDLPYDFILEAEASEMPYIIGAYCLAAVGEVDGDKGPLMKSMFVETCKSAGQTEGFYQYRFKDLTLEQSSLIAEILGSIAEDGSDDSECATVALQGFLGCLLQRYRVVRLI
jgi:hypothetical protein